MFRMKGLRNKDYDIAIVGAGMVGLTIANLFRNTSLHIALIDRNESLLTLPALEQKSPRFDPRVSALSMASRNILEELGVWKNIMDERLCGYLNMRVWDADGTGEINFSASDLNQAELGTIVENSVLIKALTNALTGVSNIDFLFPHSVVELIETNDNVELKTANDICIKAKLVIAADGSNSKIRELAGFSIKEWDYDHHAIVTTVETRKAHQKIALQRFIETGPLAFLPLLTHAEDKEQNYCSIVWSVIPERAEELMELGDKEFCEELNRSIEFRLGNIQDCEKRYCFPLKQRHALEYVKGKIVLAGDAAHSIHPLAGQGVNLGFLDARALASEINLGLGAGRKISDPIVLNRYQRKRKGHNLSMMWLMEGFKHLFAEQSLPVRWLRNIGMNGVDNFPIAKNYLARRAMGLDA